MLNGHSTRESKLPFTSYLKKSACASKLDVLELATLWYFCMGYLTFLHFLILHILLYSLVTQSWCCWVQRGNQSWDNQCWEWHIWTFGGDYRNPSPRVCKPLGIMSNLAPQLLLLMRCHALAFPKQISKSRKAICSFDL